MYAMYTTGSERYSLTIASKCRNESVALKFVLKFFIFFYLFCFQNKRRIFCQLNLCSMIHLLETRVGKYVFGVYKISLRRACNRYLTYKNFHPLQNYLWYREIDVGMVVFSLMLHYNRIYLRIILLKNIMKLYSLSITNERRKISTRTCPFNTNFSL